MIAAADCRKCGVAVVHRTPETLELRLCGACLELERAALARSVRAGLHVRGVTGPDAETIVAGVLGMMPAAPAAPRPGAVARRGTAIAAGVAAWEQFVKDAQPACGDPARRVLELRPYRAEVVRLVLEAVDAHNGGV